jgi:hypothetical protein
MMNAHGCVGGGGGFFRNIILDEYDVGLVFFFNKNLVIIVLKPQLHN